MQSWTTEASPTRYSAPQCVVEQTINARPLTAVSDDPGDLTALTPNHFMLGRENASAPFMPSSERYNDLKNSFKTAEAYAMIWKKWTREYLPQLNQRSKWSKEHVRNLKDGELVCPVVDSVKRCINWDESLRSSLATTVL